jgi:curved DNA-binding protein CbpA
VLALVNRRKPVRSRMPADSFSQLRLPRRPFLPENVVRDAFHSLAGDHHPDKTGGESGGFAELTSAYETLRNPVTFLKHLIELETIGKCEPIPAVPADLAELFPAIAQVRQQLAAAIDKQRSAPNALAHSLARVDSTNARRSGEELSEKLQVLFAGSLADLQRIDAVWPAPEARAALPSLHARLAFLTKWRDQLRESLFQLQLS